MSEVAPSLQARYENILKRMKSSHATLIAVSKTRSADEIETLYRLGHRDFGESYVQELVAKAQQLSQRGCSGIRWHMIGHLQTNKVKMLLPHVQSIHAVDSLRLAQELSKRATTLGRSPLDIFIEVNIDGETSKSGVPPAQVFELATLVHELPSLRLLGLMCIPAFNRPAAETKRSFELLRDLELKSRPMTQGQLSMGMSDDFELALDVGATHIRVGTSLFGARSSVG